MGKDTKIKYMFLLFIIFIKLLLLFFFLKNYYFLKKNIYIFYFCVHVHVYFMTSVNCDRSSALRPFLSTINMSLIPYLIVVSSSISACYGQHLQPLARSPLPLPQQTASNRSAIAIAMNFDTPTSLSVAVTPCPSPPASPKPKSKSMPPAPVCPFSGASASTSSSGTGTCPFSGASSSPPPHQHAQHTCPFATAMPSSRLPVLQTMPDGTVVQVAPRCPKWVRVLRFSAKYVAKQLIVRVAKKALVILFHSARAPSDDAASAHASGRERTETETMVGAQKSQ